MAGQTEACAAAVNSTSSSSAGCVGSKGAQTNSREVPLHDRPRPAGVGELYDLSSGQALSKCKPVLSSTQSPYLPPVAFVTLQQLHSSALVGYVPLPSLAGQPAWQGLPISSACQLEDMPVFVPCLNSRMVGTADKLPSPPSCHAADTAGHACSTATLGVTSGLPVCWKTLIH